MAMFLTGLFLREIPQLFEPFSYRRAHYSTRLLTYDADFLRSVVGILNVTSLFRAEKWISGMPSTMLDWTLLWQPTGPLHRRSGHSFPSWYWIGWARPVTRPGTTSAEITDWPFSTPEHAVENAKRPQAGSRLFRLFSPRKVQPAQRGLLVIRPLPDSKAGWSSTHRGSHRKILSGP